MPQFYDELMPTLLGFLRAPVADETDMKDRTLRGKVLECCALICAWPRTALDREVFPLLTFVPVLSFQALLSGPSEQRATLSSSLSCSRDCRVRL